MEERITPIRRQYLEIKKQHPDTIVFFRLGDFYETFDQDAEIASNELDIVLTSRNIAKGQKVPMAGIPYHAADNYIGRLIKNGFHVAICEQIGEQPKNGLFPRKVVRVITPGTVLEPGLIKNETSNYLASVFASEQILGFSYLEISTGEFFATQIERDENSTKLLSELSRINPSEIILPENLLLNIKKERFYTQIPEWKFELGRCEQILQSHFNVSSLDGFGLKNKPFAISAAGAALDYVKGNEQSSSSLFNSVKFYSLDEFMSLDDSTRHNLELCETMSDSLEKGSLLGILDKTITPMGKRIIRKWINQPLINIDKINARLDLVEFFFNENMARLETTRLLKGFSDIERIINRVISSHSTPGDLVSLRTSLSRLPELLSVLEIAIPKFERVGVTAEKCENEFELLHNAISDDPPATFQHIGIIRSGYSKELDQLLITTKNSRDWLANLEANEKKRTKIKTLKVGYNKIYGYYIEISKSYLKSIPENYIRKQTLVNAERFITPELKEYETIVLNAEENIREIESKVYRDLCKTLSQSSDKILRAANFIAVLDYSLSLAQTALENQYTRPKLHEEDHLRIVEGRHPVVEKIQYQKSFIPNNTFMDKSAFIHVITGPNMSGKSTYLRQVALIVLMAQIGSFTPANEADIGIVDRIFTRIGAQDEIHAGQSTFMVEMIETANILNNATPRSLLILDEIGRGTSTYDGLSIAWSVLEHIHNHPNLQARTLFATHYHELIELPAIYPGMKNYTIAVSESGKEVIFLHKIIEGGADKSYGVHVAQLAGIPANVIQRASSILNDLEKGRFKPGKRFSQSIPQIPLFSQNHPVLEELSQLDINTLNPIEALNKLYSWKKELEK